MTVNNSQTYNEGINLDANLAAKLHNHVTKKWQEENRGVLEALNSFHDEYGCFSDEYRTF